MDDADLELFSRSVGAATERFTGPELDAALASLGWADALELDERAAVSVLFEHQGATAAVSASLGRVIAHALGIDLNGAVVVLPALGRVEPPGTVDGGRVSVSGLAGSELSSAPAAVVVATAGSDVVAATVASTDLATREVHGLDPSMQLIEVTGLVDVSSDAAMTSPVTIDWPTAVATAHVALGHELVGASRTMLSLACDHARERVQFDRPIAAFQAVRHRLAEALVAIETADAALGAAWDDRSPITASIAKAVAGRSARTVAKHCQQVLAGIGFTTEHDLHRFIRRVLVLDQLCGSSKLLTRSLGDEVLATRRMPAQLPL